MNYAASIVSYAALAGSFGTMSYAVREGAARRDDKEQFQKFFSQVWTISLFANIAAYTILFAISLFPGMAPHRTLLYIIGLQIAAGWIGPSWVNKALEDFSYVAKRAVFMQFLCLALTFLFVRNKADIKEYAFVQTASYIGTGAANFFWGRKHVRYRLTREVDIKEHLKPMLQVFFSAITTTIYVNADQTMLGMMCGDAEVGIYSCAAKIYSVMKTVFWAVLSVAVPRMSNEVRKLSEEEWKKRVQLILEVSIIVFMPLSVLVFCLSDLAVLFLGGSDFTKAAVSLKILALSLIPSSISVFLNNICFVPRGEYRPVMTASAVSAVENVILNILAVPRYGAAGAAMTTLAAEITAAAAVLPKLKIRFEWKPLLKCVLQVMLGCAAIVVCCKIGKTIVKGTLLPAAVSVCFSMAAYMGIIFPCFRKNKLGWV